MLSERKRSQNNGRTGAGVLSLFCRVHQIELGLSGHQLIHGTIIPDRLYCDADLRVDVRLGPRFGGIFHQKFGVFSILGINGFDAELAHGEDNGFCAFYEVLEDGRAVVV